MTFLHKIKGVKNLKEMTIVLDHNEKDGNKKYEEQDLTFFEMLCRDTSISNFKIIVLVGS